MEKGAEWGLWIAVCMLVVGIAKFYDDYHIKNHIRSKFRDRLIICFLFLDQPRFTNFPKKLYNFLNSGFSGIKSLLSLPLAALIIYLLMVSSFYIARSYSLFGSHPSEEDFLTYAFSWVNSFFWAIVIAWGILCGIISFKIINPLLKKWNRTELLSRQWGISSITLLAVGLCTHVARVGFSEIGAMNPNLGLGYWGYTSGYFLVGAPAFVYALSAVCSWHAIAIAGAMLTLTIFRTLYIIVHRGILSILDAASNPKISPFQYFAAMIALTALIFKLIDEALKYMAL